MQLQKLVFFAHGAHLAAYGSPLIDGEVRAWDFGPVIPELYERLREYGSGYVDSNLGGHRQIGRAGPEIQAVLSVWQAYREHSAWELSNISHRRGSPWDEVWNNGGRYSVIPDRLTRDYYRDRITHMDRAARGW
ncbi:hypothetical protein D3C77_528750 [compost metagenome]